MWGSGSGFQPKYMAKLSDTNRMHNGLKRVWDGNDRVIQGTRSNVGHLQFLLDTVEPWNVTTFKLLDNGFSLMDVGIFPPLFYVHGHSINRTPQILQY